MFAVYILSLFSASSGKLNMFSYWFQLSISDSKRSLPY